MRRMYSESELREVVKKYAVEGLVGKDISVNGITSKGIANTGTIANIGDIATTGAITGGSIIENMSPEQYRQSAKVETLYIEFTYTSAVKNGNKLTLVVAGKIKVPTGSSYSKYTIMGSYEFLIPTSVMNKIYPAGAGGLSSGLSAKIIDSFYNYEKKTGINCLCNKVADYGINITFYGTDDSIDKDVDYAFRWEETFLLSKNFIPEESEESEE